MSDLFEEVEDEMRWEQIRRVAKKFAPYIIWGLVAAFVIGAGIVGYSFWRDRQFDRASVSYDAALEAVAQGDPEVAFNALGDVAAKGPAIYKYMALSHQAGIRVQQDRIDDAVALLDRAAEAAPKTEAGLVVADIARLKAAWLILDTAPYAQVETRLKDLTAENRPMKALATYSLAVAKIRAGRGTEARADLLLITSMLDAPEGMTTMAQSAIDLIDSGAAAALPDVTARKIALPAPQMQITPEMIQQMMQQQGGGGQ